jgi:uncharacterized protein (DUF58 family)
MEQHTPTQPAGLLLGKVGLVAILIGLVLSAWNGQFIVSIVLGLVLATAGLARLWSRFSLKGVSCRRWLSEARAFPGEHIELQLEISNRKLLPLPWVQVDDEIPISFTDDIVPAQEARAGYGLLSRTAAMLWYSKVSWRCRLQCSKRGFYKLGPVKVTSGDIFGFYPRTSVEPSTENVIVYPRIFPVGQLGLPSLYPLGDTRAEKRIFEDPTRLMGVRDYRPSDSLRRIHWKATARHQNLQVKVFEPTTTLDVAIFLAVDSFNHDGTCDDDFEIGISLAGSLAKCITEQGTPAGLFVNSRLVDSGQPARILPGSSGYQLVSILEVLAKVTRFSSAPFTDYLQAERKYLPWGTTLIFVMANPSQPVQIMLANLKENGYKLRVFRIGEQDAGGLDHMVPFNSVEYAASKVLESQ